MERVKKQRAMKYLVAIVAASLLLPVLGSLVAALTQWNPDLNPNSGWVLRCGQWWGGYRDLPCPFRVGDWWGGYATGDSKWEGNVWYQEVTNERSGESYVAEAKYDTANRLPVAGGTKELHVVEKDGAISLCVGAVTWAGNVVGIHMQYEDGSYAGFLEIYFKKGGLNDYWCYGYNGWQPVDPQRNFMYYMQTDDEFVESTWVDGAGWRHWIIDLSGLIDFMDSKSKVDWCFRTPMDLELDTAYIHQVNAYGEAGNLIVMCLNGPTWARWRVDDIKILY